MGVRSWVAENPRDPRTPGLLVGAFAFLFSSLYFGWTYVGGVWVVSAGAMAVNAVVWTALVWQRHVVPRETVTQWQAVAVGLRIAVGAHLTSGVALYLGWTGASLVAGPYRLEHWLTRALETGLVDHLLSVLLGAALMAVVGAVSTFGVPTAAAVAVCVLVVRYGGLEPETN